MVEVRKQQQVRWSVFLPTALAAGVAGLLLVHLGDFPLENWDEAIYAEVNRELVRTGDWVTPHYNHAPYYNKPPLYFWLGHLPMRFGGFNEWTSRFPGVVFGALTVWATAAFAMRLGGSAAAVGAVLLLAANAMFLENGSRHATPDSLLLFLWVAALWQQWDSRSRPSRRWVVGLLAGSAVLTKGAAAVPLWLALGVLHLSCGEQYLPGQFAYAWPVLIAAIAWLVCSWLARGDASRWRQDRRATIVTLAVAVAMPILVFSFARNKAWWYVLPTLPPLCIAGGLVITSRSPGRARRMVTRVFTTGASGGIGTAGAGQVT